MDEFELDIEPRFSARVGLWIVAIPVQINVGIGGVIHQDLEFRFDTGTDITQIPTRVLPADIVASLSRNRIFSFRTASGTGEGRELNFTFSFMRFAPWSFPSVGVLNETLTHGLLAPRDVFGRFHLQTRGIVDVSTERHPNVVARVGRLALRLRDGHDGIRTRTTTR